MRRQWAYLIGLALGDGNLSNPNGRAVRLRITCDARYPRIAKDILRTLRLLFPDNSVSIVRNPSKDTFYNISVYSNTLREWMPWRVNYGTKELQNAHVPEWIVKSKTYSRECIRGLLQTDGSIYSDRGYLMVNFCNNVEALANDMMNMLTLHGFRPRLSKTGTPNGKIKYTVRVARDADKLVRRLNLYKK